MACFLCNNPNVEENRKIKILCSFFDCPHCGKYGYSDYIKNDLLNFHNKATCIATERKFKGMDKFLLVDDSNLNKYLNANLCVFSPIGVKAFLQEYPRDAIEMFDRILLTLGRLISILQNHC